MSATNMRVVYFDVIKNFEQILVILYCCLVNFLSTKGLLDSNSFFNIY